MRWIARQFGEIFGKDPSFEGEEQPTAILSNAAECTLLFGYPRTPPKKIIQLLAEWLEAGGKTINKPTHFQERTGKY